MHRIEKEATSQGVGQNKIISRGKLTCNILLNN